MTVTSFEAAKKLGEVTNWKLSNLQMQKILYLAHMFFMGRNGGVGENDEGRLIDESFEAWDYGPVLPKLYHKVKDFGSGHVKDVFFFIPWINDTPEALIIEEVGQIFQNVKPSGLVEATHQEDGAWEKNYQSDAKGIKIPDDDIMAEYGSS